MVYSVLVPRASSANLGLVTVPTSLPKNCQLESTCELISSLLPQCTGRNVHLLVRAKYYYVYKIIFFKHFSLNEESTMSGYI